LDQEGKKIMGCDSQFDPPAKRGYVESFKGLTRTLVKDNGPRIETTRFPQEMVLPNWKLKENSTGQLTKDVGVPGQAGPVQVEEKTLEPLQSERPPLTEFEQKLKSLINAYSMENLSGTPDFILAEFLSHCLNAFALATRAREHWYGRRVF
jgi:hypothetical protein